jgi:hypothetical protein
MRSRHRHRSWEITFDAKVKEAIQRSLRDPTPFTAQASQEAFISLTSTYPIMARFLFLEDALALSTGGGSVPVAPINLGTAANYAILTKAGIAAGAGANVVTGNMGVSPAAAASITGFGLVLDGSGQFSTSAQVSGHVFAADYAAPTPATLTLAVADMMAAYTAGNALPPTSVNFNGGNLGGQTLAPGVYKFTTGVTIPTSLTLDGSASDVWVFQIAGTLDLAVAQSIILAGGAVASNVFWVVAGATEIHANAVFNGNILSQVNVAMDASARINGRLLCQTAVTLVGSDIINQ